MNSKKARGRARLLRKNEAEQLAASVEAGGNDADLERLGRQIEAAAARGDKIELEKMSVKDRKRFLRARPLISNQQRKDAELARDLVAKAQANARSRKSL
jgi:hypothetical protein